MGPCLLSGKGCSHKAAGKRGNNGGGEVGGVGSSWWEYIKRTKMWLLLDGCLTHSPLPATSLSSPQNFIVNKISKNMGLSSSKHIGCFFCTCCNFFWIFIYHRSKNFLFGTRDRHNRQQCLLSMNFVDYHWPIEIQKLFYRFIALRFSFSSLYRILKVAFMVQREKSLKC